MDPKLKELAKEYQGLLQGRSRLSVTPADFKSRVVAAAREFSREEVAQATGLNPATVRRWGLAFEIPDETPFQDFSVSRISVEEEETPAPLGDIEIFTAGGDTVRVPFREDALERVLSAGPSRYRGRALCLDQRLTGL